MRRSASIWSLTIRFWFVQLDVKELERSTDYCIDECLSLHLATGREREMWGRVKKQEEVESGRSRTL